MRNGTVVDREVKGEYATRHLTRKAVGVIQNHNISQPLFLYIPQLAVHTANEYDPVQAPQETIDKVSYIDDEYRRLHAGTCGNK
jgi:alanyl-tRNA synthetase